MENKWVSSLTGKDDEWLEGKYDSADEAINAAIKEFQDKIDDYPVYDEPARDNPDFVYIGQTEKIEIVARIDTDKIIEMIAESTKDNCDVCSDGIVEEVSDAFYNCYYDFEKVLEKTIEDFIKTENIKIETYRVVGVERIEI